MLAAEARVPTALPHRYMSQLCKHFDHSLPVVLEEASARIAFAMGVCTLRAEADALVMHVTAADAEALARMEDVVARHLVRFAFRDAPEVIWVAA